MAFCKRYGDGTAYELSFKPRTLARWRRIARQGGAFIERRGRKAGSRSAKIGPAAWDFFVTTKLKLNVPIAHAFDMTLAKAAEPENRVNSAWTWTASLSAVRKRFSAEHKPFYRDYYLEGPDKWRAKYQPKLDRRQTEQPANYIWELDGTKANVLVRHDPKGIIRCGIIRDLTERCRGTNGSPGEPLYSLEDVKRVFAKSQLRIASDALRFLEGVANEPESGGLRLATNAVRLAVRIAQSNAEPIEEITLQMLLDASRLLKGTEAANAIANRIQERRAGAKVA